MKIKRRLFLAMLPATGFAVMGCDSATSSAPQPTPQSHRPTAAELDQQTFARQAAILRDIHRDYKIELNTLSGITPTPAEQPTPSIKLTLPDYNQAHSIAQASTKILADLDTRLRNAGYKPNGIPGDNALHDELEPVAGWLNVVKTHINYAAAQTRAMYRIAPNRYISQSDLIILRRGINAGYEALTQTYNLLDQPTSARGLSLEAL